MITVIAIVSFIIIIVVLILAHELGHFITAKATGVKVEEFGLGFPPRLLSFKRGETLYSLARRYGTTVWAIAMANNIYNPNVIYSGKRLIIP